MKSFHLTVFTITAFFITIMCVVAVQSFKRASNSTGIDPSQINKVREMARK